MTLLNDLLALVNKYAGPVVTYLSTFGVTAGLGVTTPSTSALVSVVPTVAHFVADLAKDSSSAKVSVKAAQDTVA
jgi:hypothetical protein